MVKLLFIGHTFHQKSRSSAFFLDALRERFTVVTHFVDPDALDVAAIPDDDFDAVVLWQVDFLGPLAIAKGYRTIVVPMYDASADLPALHWELMSEALFINFSARLHSHISGLGGRSLFARYYPDPAAATPVTSYDELRGFFWRRRPNEIDIEVIDRLLGDRLTSLHVHDAPDYGEPRSLAATSLGFGECTVTRSTWFPTGAEYLEALEGANVFFAPRAAEGIGMGFLEALARGMVVIATDRPTHSEYIRDGFNGLLFDPRKARPLRLENAEAIGTMARTIATRGHRHYRLQEQAVLGAIADFAAPRQPSTEALREFALEALAGYRTSVETYSSVLETLKDEIEFHVLTRLGPVRELIGVSSGGDPKADGALEKETVAGSLAGAVHLTFGHGGASQYYVEGWSEPEGAHTWIDGTYGSIRIPLGEALFGACVLVAIDAFTVDPLKGVQTVTVKVGGVSAGTVKVDYTFHEGGTLRLETTCPLPEQENLLIEFQCDRSWQEPNEGRDLSLGLRALSLIRR